MKATVKLKHPKIVIVDPKYIVYSISYVEANQGFKNAFPSKPNLNDTITIKFGKIWDFPSNL